MCIWLMPKWRESDWLGLWLPETRDWSFCHFVRSLISSNQWPWHFTIMGLASMVSRRIFVYICGRLQLICNMIWYMWYVAVQSGWAAVEAGWLCGWSSVTRRLDFIACWWRTTWYQWYWSSPGIQTLTPPTTPSSAIFRISTKPAVRASILRQTAATTIQSDPVPTTPWCLPRWPLWQRVATGSRSFTVSRTTTGVTTTLPICTAARQLPWRSVHRKVASS